jgi:hypothetical protein
MHEIRSIVAGDKREIVRLKTAARRKTGATSLSEIAIHRTEPRRTDGRREDRNGSSGGSASVRYLGRLHRVEVINLSSKGAMITERNRSADRPRPPDRFRWRLEPGLRGAMASR